MYEFTDKQYRDYSAIIEAGLVQCTPQCNVQPPLTNSDAVIYIRDATGNQHVPTQSGVLAIYQYQRNTVDSR